MSLGRQPKRDSWSWAWCNSERGITGLLSGDAVQSERVATGGIVWFGGGGEWVGEERAGERERRTRVVKDGEAMGLKAAMVDTKRSQRRIHAPAVPRTTKATCARTTIAKLPCFETCPAHAPLSAPLTPAAAIKARMQANAQYTCIIINHHHCFDAVLPGSAVPSCMTFTPLHPPPSTRHTGSCSIFFPY